MSIFSDPRHYGVSDHSDTPTPEPWWKVIVAGVGAIALILAITELYLMWVP